MELPNNVLRPEASDWSGGTWPEPFDCLSLECRPRLALLGLGAHVTRIAPGGRSCPLHAHAFEEEVFLVLEGTLTVRELSPGADTYREYQLYEGEAAVYRPGTGLAHGFYNRSDTPVTFMGLSDDCGGEVATYPDSGKTLLRNMRKIGVFSDEEADVIAQANAAAGQRPVRSIPDGKRPSRFVAAVAEQDMGGAFGQQLSVAGGARKVMLNRDRLTPDAWTSPLHWHSAEQELVVVLSGTATLHQLRGKPAPKNERGGPDGPPDFAAGVKEAIPLRPGDMVHFGPNVPVAHHLHNHSEEDCILLVVGLKDPTDIVFFPAEGRLHVKALGRSGVMVSTPYFAGEIPSPTS